MNNWVYPQRVLEPKTEERDLDRDLHCMESELDQLIFHAPTSQPPTRAEYHATGSNIWVGASSVLPSVSAKIYHRFTKG